MGVMALRGRLGIHYKLQGYVMDVEHIHTIDQMTIQMLGSAKSPKLKSAGAEAKSIVGFLIELLYEFQGRLGPKCAFLLKSVQALQAYYDIMGSTSRKLDLESRAKMFDCCLTCIRSFQLSGADLTQKFHLWVHLTVAIAVHGCPRFYSTHADEAFNGTLKAIAAKTHPATFCDTIVRRILLGEPLVHADR